MTDRAKILEMVEKGIITASEAEELLDFLENDFNIKPKYIYCFKENPEYLIYHFCLGKIKENEKIIEELKKENAFLCFQDLN